MGTMIKEVYEAFIDAGASEEKAADAAQALADYGDRFNKIESGLVLLKWMVGFVIAGVLSLLGKLFV